MLPFLGDFWLLDWIFVENAPKYSSQSNFRGLRAPLKHVFGRFSRFFNVKTTKTSLNYQEMHGGGVKIYPPKSCLRTDLKIFQWAAHGKVFKNNQSQKFGPPPAWDEMRKFLE